MINAKAWSNKLLFPFLSLELWLKINCALLNRWSHKLVAEFAWLNYSSNYDKFHRVCFWMFYLTLPSHTSLRLNATTLTAEIFENCTTQLELEPLAVYATNPQTVFPILWIDTFIHNWTQLLLCSVWLANVLTFQLVRNDTFFHLIHCTQQQWQCVCEIIRMELCHLQVCIR